VLNKNMEGVINYRVDSWGYEKVLYFKAHYKVTEEVVDDWGPTLVTEHTELKEFRHVEIVFEPPIPTTYFGMPDFLTDYCLACPADEASIIGRLGECLAEEGIRLIELQSGKSTMSVEQYCKWVKKENG
jgi:hypothetical protein